MPYIVVFKPYVYTEETADKWATVDKVQAVVTELKQEVINLKSMIVQILSAVETTAPQGSTTASFSIGNADEHNAAAAPLTPLTAVAATGEPIPGTRSAAAQAD
jgi:hypothetical protein